MLTAERRNKNAHKTLIEYDVNVYVLENYNSYFFDIINDTASMKSLQNSIDNGADDWYLVPVDFHF